jgi:hypothetical protein
MTSTLAALLACLAIATLVVALFFPDKPETSDNDDEDDEDDDDWDDFIDDDDWEDFSEDVDDDDNNIITITELDDDGEEIEYFFRFEPDCPWSTEQRNAWAYAFTQAHRSPEESKQEKQEALAEVFKNNQDGNKNVSTITAIYPLYP